MYRKRQTYTPSTGTNTQLGCYTEMSSGNINLQKKNSLTQKESGKELTLPSAKTVETTRSCYREESAPPMVFINTISILVLSHPRQLSVKLALTWQVKKKNTLATNEARWGRGTDRLPCRGQSPDITIRPTREFSNPLKKLHSWPLLMNSWPLHANNSEQWWDTGHARQMKELSKTGQ